ncbi:preprotein translocase subunit SecD [Isoalcanivorax pacificus W11-5]|uniref:Protein translocase subunit SecD n=1 Tax=Isoalcanivorax pacificus W11-5 TaxID=391936 RepID=A0A0B4XGB1_9GAMM|nr:protein translocase subunit SecD [Isoalcanivorax pacificus]AJD47139.1 preprotein translocase subunit SecD [Isoalcanivorax pacificus W11-5]
MNRYPRGKFILLLVVLVVCGLYALPNLYPDAPAIQITRSEAGVQVSQDAISRLNAALDEAGIGYGAGEAVGDSWLLRLNDSEAQLRARELAERTLGRDYVVALNLAPTTPPWLRSIGASPVGLGLDLRGGVHFLLQVDMDTAIDQRLDAWAAELRVLLRDQGIRYREVTYEGREVIARFDNAEDVDAAQRAVGTQFVEFSQRREYEQNQLRFTLTETALREIQDYAIDQNRTALNNRVNELGVASPVVQREGADRIVVQLPGVQDASQARRILGRTATLEFRLVADDVDPARARSGIAPPGTEIFPFKGDTRNPVILRRQNIVTGDQVTNAQMGFDENGQPEVNISLDAAGARNMQRVTSRNVNKPMAVLFIETRTDIETVINEDGEREQKANTYREAYVINVANIRDTLGSRFRITGLDSPAGAAELALLLRAGGLAAPMYIAEERTIGPSLGADNIEAGMKSMLLGLVLVLGFMLVRYKVFGIFANIALLGNLVVIIGIMSMIPGVTLTLPGIAGIVLTVGMAVDANVLIYERIRQELADGRPPLQAIDAGYDRAFQTILDANITTLIVAVILFAAGTGTVQGFAVTLFIGILSSMFTAIIGTRALADLFYGARQRAPTRLSI